MDDIVRIVGIAIVMTVLLTMLRGAHAPIGVQLGIAFAATILLILMDPLRDLMQFFAELGRRSGMQGGYVDTVLRAVGIAYIAGIGAQIAKDAGEAGIAAVVELAGKISILIVAMPIVGAILASLLSLLP